VLLELSIRELSFTVFAVKSNTIKHVHNKAIDIISFLIVLFTIRALRRPLEPSSDARIAIEFFTSTALCWVHYNIEADRTSEVFVKGLSRTLLRFERYFQIFVVFL
jgi:hypothetical protein